MGLLSIAKTSDLGMVQMPGRNLSVTDVISVKEAEVAGISETEIGRSAGTVETAVTYHAEGLPCHSECQHR